MNIDIGCGSKEQTKPYHLGVDVNLDYGPDIVHDCNKGIPFGDETADNVWMDNSLEHFKNPYFILQECHRVLKPGGTVKIKLPNLQYLPIIAVMPFGDILKLWNLWMNSPWKKIRTQHYTLWTPEVLRLALETNGFTITNTSGWLYSKEIYAEAQKND